MNMTLIIGLGSFITSMLLHLLFMYLFHRYHRLHKFLPFTHTVQNKKTKQSTKIRLYPTFHIADHMVHALENDRTFRWHDKCVITPMPPDAEMFKVHSETHL